MCTPQCAVFLDGTRKRCNSSSATGVSKAHGSHDPAVTTNNVSHA